MFETNNSFSLSVVKICGDSTVTVLVRDDKGISWFCFVALDSMTCHNSYFVDFVDGGERVRLVHYSRINNSRQVNQTISCGCMSLRHDERHA